MDRILLNYPVFLPYSVPFSGKKGVLDAVRHGKLGTMKHLCQMGKHFNFEMMASAAERGYLHIVKYLYRMGQRGTSHALFIACVHGKLEIVKYLYEMGVRALNYSVADYAAYNGHLETVKYLYEMGDKCSSLGMDWAMTNGQLEMIKYLDSLGVESEIIDRLAWARKYSPKFVPYFQSLNAKQNLSLQIV